MLSWAMLSLEVSNQLLLLYVMLMCGSVPEGEDVDASPQVEDPEKVTGRFCLLIIWFLLVVK